MVIDGINKCTEFSGATTSRIGNPTRLSRSNDHKYLELFDYSVITPSRSITIQYDTGKTGGCKRANRAGGGSTRDGNADAHIRGRQ